MRAIPLRHRSARHQRGTAAIELGMAMLPLVLLLMGTIEFGRALYTYNTLVKGAQSAARHLSLANPEDTAVQQQARNLLRYGDVSATGTLLVPGLENSNIDFCTPARTSRPCRGMNRNVATGHGTLDLVTVTVTGYRYPLIWVPARSTSTTVKFNDIAVTVRARP